MNILINTPELELPGGVAYYYRTIKPYFEYDVTYFTTGSRSGVQNKISAIWRMIKDYWLFFVAINTNDYDVIHINPSLGAKSFVRDALFIILAKLSRKRVIVFFRGWDSEYEAFSEKYLLWLYKISYFRVDAIIVLAEQFKNKLISLGYNGKIYIETTVVGDDVYNNYDLTERVYDNNVINILFLSRIEKSKGIYELIDALKILNSKYNNLLLTVAGSGGEEDAAEHYARQCGIHNISFTGYITGKDKQKAFKDADIFAFPTYYGEGMPNAVLEAMAYGLPVLTRPVGGLGDFFENDKMGCLIKEVDANIYSRCLEKLIEDERLRINISRYNREYSEKHFKACHVVNRLENIYLELSK